MLEALRYEISNNEARVARVTRKGSLIPCENSCSPLLFFNVYPFIPCILPNSWNTYSGVSLLKSYPDLFPPGSLPTPSIWCHGGDIEARHCVVGAV